MKGTERKKQIKRCDDLASEIVRRRAVERSGGCDRCKRYHSWKELQCAHYISRVKFSIRWDLDNLAGLCGGCHRFIDRSQEAKDILFIEFLGGLEFLKARDKYTGKTDLDLIEIYLKEKIKELE